MLSRTVRGSLRRLPPVVAQQARERLPSATRGTSGEEGHTRAANGASFVGQVDDFHASVMLAHGYYEWRIWVLAQEFALPGATIIEVGANVGTETVCLAGVVGGTGRVLAFEPVPENLRWLERNRELNPGLAIEVEAVAIAGTNGEMAFFEPPRARSGSGYLADADTPAPSEPGWTRIVVPVRRLDDYLPDIERLDLLVMDVEGSEPSVLAGAAEAIKRFRPPIILEADAGLLRRVGFSGGLQDLHDDLVGLGYRAHTIGRAGLTEVAPPFAAQARQNWLCLPAETPRAVVNKAQRRIRRGLLAPVVRGLSPLSR